MAPRQRNPRNRKHPAGVRERNGYFSWIHPLTGEEFGLGRDQRKAYDEAIEANLKIRAQKKVRLIDRIEGTDKRTWASWIDEFEKIIFSRKLAPNTVRTRRSQMNRLRAMFEPDTIASQITTLMCSEAIEAIKAEGKARMAQSMRSFMVDCFDRMIARGWRSDNPVRVTDTVQVEVNRARLEFDVFMQLYNTTTLQPLKRAMALALVSGQPRECLVAAQFSDHADNRWHNHRGKTNINISLSHDLRLDCFGMSLGDVIRMCRSTGIASRYVIHHDATTANKKSPVGAKFHLDKLTRMFTDELAKLGLSFGTKTPPTLHEIRSLSERLYDAQGNVKTQDLLGHKQAKTTGVYHDVRGGVRFVNPREMVERKK